MSREQDKRNIAGAAKFSGNIPAGRGSMDNDRQFLGRSSELGKLEEIFASDAFEFGVIYGRRRIGKSTLLKKFMQGKPSVYLVANEKNLN